MTDTQMEAAPPTAGAMASVFSSRSFHRLQLRHFLLFDVLPLLGTIASIALLPLLRPGVIDLARVLQQSETAKEDIETLLTTQILFWLLAAPDGHAKNFSIRLLPRGQYRLTPLYDVMSTVALELTDNAGRPLLADTHLGQRVGGRTDIWNVGAADIVQEAVSWGIRRKTATAVVSDTIDQVISATQTLEGDQRVLATIRQRTEHMTGPE